jgi:hypothetical protein
VSFVHFSTSAQLGRAEIQNSTYGRTRYFVSAGLTFSPGEIPLILW